LYAEQGFSHQARRLLRRCATGELTCILPQTVGHELTHRLMLAEAEMFGRVSGPNAARKLARQTEAIKSLGLYRDKIRALVNLGLGYEPCKSNKLGFLLSRTSMQRCQTQVLKKQLLTSSEVSGTYL
jgi:hypothetical protein